jgi:pyruvate dehydrogenase E2 component (dihydrolipoamide acetyltransferase)
VGADGGAAEGGGRQAEEAPTATKAPEREPAGHGVEEPETEPEARQAAEAPPEVQAPQVQPDREPAEEEQAPPSDAGRAPPSDQVKASPMARALARDRGIDLQALRGSGPSGRVIRADVEAAVAGDGRAAQAPPAEAPPAKAPPGVRRPTPDEVEELPLTNIRRVVARRMVESVQSAPHFYLTSIVDAEALTKLRAELNERLASGDDAKLSVNDLLIKACATAIKASPDVNVSFAGDKILRHKRIHIGVAVALEGGLIVPVIRDVDRKSLGEISREARTLIDKARGGKLTPDEYSGGTFTISNLGMFGVDHFTAVINPPEAAILAVGATTPEAVARDGHVVVRNTIKLTLSIDHRALDGATAARFLQRLKEILEEPLRILV